MCKRHHGAACRADAFEVTMAPACRGFQIEFNQARKICCNRRRTLCRYRCQLNLDSVKKRRPIGLMRNRRHDFERVIGSIINEPGIKPSGNHRRPAPHTYRLCTIALGFRRKSIDGCSAEPTKIITVSVRLTALFAYHISILVDAFIQNKNIIPHAPHAIENHCYHFAKCDNCQ